MAQLPEQPTLPFDAAVPDQPLLIEQLLTAAEQAHLDGEPPARVQALLDEAEALQGRR